MIRFDIYKTGPSVEDVHAECNSSLELLDAFLNWRFLDQWGGWGGVWKTRDIRLGWMNWIGLCRPANEGYDPKEYVLFDLTRLHDLEYIEQYVVELWERAHETTVS